MPVPKSKRYNGYPTLYLARLNRAAVERLKEVGQEPEDWLMPVVQLMFWYLEKEFRHEQGEARLDVLLDYLPTHGDPKEELELFPADPSDVEHFPLDRMTKARSAREVAEELVIWANDRLERINPDYRESPERAYLTPLDLE